MAEDSTQPPHATRFVETTRGILSYSQLAPLLAERVLRTQEDIEDGIFAVRVLNESLLLDFHRAICGDLTPDWAGRFRVSEVKVGQHSPPPPHQVPMLIHDYFADLNTRLAAISETNENLLLETLAFAEGRLLFIHPFPDFNGRVTRLLLIELLRRKDLPPVELVPTTGPARQKYVRALQSADRLDWMPLTELWQERLEGA
jgi:CRISPR-associated endonuclease/helicase Cas3